ncbi:MAG TPA: hypothetical protein VGK10_00725, partial [Prolixibacteraceae bacterium]
MKLKLLLLFLVVAGFGLWGNAQETKPYTNLIITEAQMGNTEHNYMELTNMGSETINLKNFELGHVGAWDGNLDQQYPQVLNPKKFMMLPDKELAPGKSYLIAIASDYNPEFWKKDPANYRERVSVKDFYFVKDKKIFTIADLLLFQPESPGPA